MADRDHAAATVLVERTDGVFTLTALATEPDSGDLLEIGVNLGRRDRLWLAWRLLVGPARRDRIDVDASQGG